MRVLFVCRGNTCRSPMAAQLLLYRLRGTEGIDVVSAGTDALAGDPMTPEARAYVRRATGTVLPHRARPLRPLDVRQADLVLAMTTQVLSTVSRMAPAMTHRMPTLCVAADAGSSVWHGDRDIADPFGCGAAAYGRVGDRISVAVDAVAAGLRVGVMKEVSDVRATL